MNKKYIKRIAENELKLKMHSSGCVLVSGPKFCGKSEMCKQYSKSSYILDTNSKIEAAEIDPYLAIKGDNPHLVDEWQKVPDIWNIIRTDLDNDYKPGKYLLTGSTTPANPKLIQHSGAGRITRMILKPFSLIESDESNGHVSLKELFNKNYIFESLIEDKNRNALEELAYMMCRGGWPLSVLSEKEYSIQYTKNYYEGLFTITNENDEYSKYLENINIDLLKTILKSYARNISSECKKTVMISNIIESGLRTTLDESTFDKYIDVLKNLFIIYDIPAWSLNLRSSTIIRTSPTHHFIDTSIALAALDINPNDLFNDMNSFGLFFEDFAIRDLSIYAQSFNATLKHYRDSTGQEIDAIIELPNGDYGAIEIKMYSQNNIQEAIKSLNSFEKKILKSKYKEPKFKMILTSHGPCYKNKDIYIIPITSLKN